MPACCASAVRGSARGSPTRPPAQATYGCSRQLTSIRASCYRSLRLPSATAAAIPGLAQADAALLAILIKEALDAEFHLITWPAAKARAEEQGMTAEAIDEAFAALENRRYLKVRSGAGGPYTVEVTAAAFRKGIDAVVPGAEAARRQVIATLVNEPPAGDRPVRDLAELTGTPYLFVLQFLKQLEQRGEVTVTEFLGGTSRITSARRSSGSSSLTRPSQRLAEGRRGGAREVRRRRLPAADLGRPPRG